MSKIFEKEVLDKLTSIEVRLANIEERFDEATSFADGIIDGDGGILGMEGLNSIKDTFSTLLGSQAPTNDAGDVANKEVTLESFEGDQFQDLVGSLKDFKERLAGIREAISDIPDEVIDSANDD